MECLSRCTLGPGITEFSAKRKDRGEMPLEIPERPRADLPVFVVRKMTAA